MLRNDKLNCKANSGSSLLSEDNSEILVLINFFHLLLQYCLLSIDVIISGFCFDHRPIKSRPGSPVLASSPRTVDRNKHFAAQGSLT